MAAILLATSIVLFNSAALMVRKRLSSAELYCTIIFGLFVQSLTDIYASFRFYAWGFFKIEQAELTSLWIILGIYPASAVLIINWYPYHSVWWKKALYLFVWTIYSTGYEWLCVKTGVIWHGNWTLWESFFLYPIIYYMLVLHVRFVRWLNKSADKTSNR